MGLIWRAVCLDDISNPGLIRYQDITQWLPIEQAQLAPTASDKTDPAHIVVSFPMDTPDLFLKESMEVWAGVWNDDAGVWAIPVFGGHIGVQTGKYSAEDHTFEWELLDYTASYPPRTTIIGWPTVPTTFDVVGYPYGYSVGDYLIGNAPFPGLVRAFLDDVLWDVDDVFFGVILVQNNAVGIYNIDNDLLTTDSHNGFYFTNLKKALDTLVQVPLVTSGGSIQPSYWMSAVAQGDKIVPMFHFKDMAKTTAPPTCTIAADADPAAGEVQLLQTFTHERDFRAATHEVVVKGQYEDATLGLDPPDAPMVYWVEWRADHAAQYSVPRHIKSKRWGGEPIINSQVQTVAHARALAELVEQQVWGAIGTLTLPIDWFGLTDAFGETIDPWDYVGAGKWIRFRDPVEGLRDEFGELGVNYPVLACKVTLNAGNPLFTLKVGQQQRDLSDTIKGGSLAVPLYNGDVLRSRFGTGAQRGGTSSSFAMPRLQAIDSTPVHARQNVMVPRYRDVTAMTVDATARVRPPGDGTGLADPGADNLPNMWQFRDTDKNVRDWHTPLDNVNHPIRMPFHFPVEGTTIETMFDPADFQRLIVHGSGCIYIERETDPDVWVALDEPAFYRLNSDGGVVFNWANKQHFDDEHRIRVTATLVVNMTVGICERPPIGPPSGSDPGTISWGVCSSPPPGT